MPSSTCLNAAASSEPRSACRLPQLPLEAATAWLEAGRDRSRRSVRKPVAFVPPDAVRAAWWGETSRSYGNLSAGILRSGEPGRGRRFPPAPAGRPLRGGLAVEAHSVGYPRTGWRPEARSVTSPSQQTPRERNRRGPGAGCRRRARAPRAGKRFSQVADEPVAGGSRSTAGSGSVSGSTRPFAWTW